MSASSVGSPGRAVAIAAVALVAALAVGTPAAVRPADAQAEAATAEELGLEVMVGFDGRRSSSPWQPVAVVVEPARGLEATLAVEVRSASGGQREERRIEAAARTRKAFRFVVPTGPVSVTVTEPDRAPLTVRADARGDRRGFLVGLVGQLPADLPSLRSEPTGFSGTWVPVESGWAAVSPAAFAPLGTLVATVADLEALDGRSRANLAAAVSRGTDLVVVAERAGALPQLGALRLPAAAMTQGRDGVLAPEAPDGVWTVSAAEVSDTDDRTPVAAAAPLGRGRVVLTGVAPGAGDLGASGRLWSLVTGPQPGGVRDSNLSVQRAPHLFGQIFAERDGSAPTLPWLAVFIIGYVLVAGPVNGVLLSRMGRRELAWVTVPLVTVIFTAAAFFGAVTARPSSGTGGHVAAWVDGVGTELVAAQVRTPTAGTQVLGLDGADWTVRTLVDGGRRGVVTRDGSEVRASFDLAPLQPAGVVAERASGERPPLDVDVGRDGDTLVVAVTNVGSVPLDAVVVRSATASRRIGTLAPGAAEEVALDVSALPAVPPFQEPIEGFGIGPPATLEALLRDGVLEGAPGMVWAVATTPQGRPPAHVHGRAVEDRGGVVAVGVTPPPDAGLGPSTVTRDVVVPGEGHQSGVLAVEASEVFLRFRLPHRQGLDTLGEDLRRGEAHGRIDLTVWSPVHGEWRDLDQAFPDGTGDPAELVDPLGQVWVRATGDLYPFDFSARSLHGRTRRR